MKFNYYGVCHICGCGTSGEGTTDTQSDYSVCYGCGSEYHITPQKDSNGNIMKGFIKNKIQRYGTCLTKDNELITFSEKPSKERISELSQNAKSFVIWNEDSEWLDVICGAPLMRKDVILLERDYTVIKHTMEPNTN